MSVAESSSKGATHWKKLTVQEMQGAKEVSDSEPSQTILNKPETLAKPETLSKPQDDNSQKSRVEPRGNQLSEKGYETEMSDAEKDNLTKSGETEAKNAAASVSATVKALAQVQSALEPGSDLEKRQRRAERFGVSVQLSENEKRKARAARFGGISPGTLGPSLSGSEEEKKRKARAERFGLPASSNLDEEAKKKARMERFGTGIKSDSVEVEKREARAARFALKSNDGASDVNKKVDTNAPGAVATV